ncbi:MAG TPA: EscU/YscU/HrcU family type III secretion system export apparatus switch protein [Chloroflexota bacterium]|nr:EscU/YscU/HrcU family type III secretion system export apparatus switch protein [Chloroflexota bacterium]
MTETNRSTDLAAGSDRARTAVALGGGLAAGTAGAGAPFVAAAGRGALADEIVRLAERAGVPVEHDPALASLLGSLSVGQTLPPEMYQVIAELLVFLYDLDAQFEHHS